MRPMLFADSIRLRAEPGLRDAIHQIARKEKTTAAEFLRRELRSMLERRGVTLPPVGDAGAAS